MAKKKSTGKSDDDMDFAIGLPADASGERDYSPQGWRDQ